MTVIGALNWDINLFVKHIPKPGEEVVVTRIDRVPGGKGGNVAVAAARILGPLRTALISCLGSDETGKKQIAILTEEGIESSGVRVIPRVESGQAYITVDENGDDTIMTHFGANALLKEEQIMEPEIQSMLGKSKLILAIDPPKEVAKKILSEGKRLRKILVWHPGVLARFGIKEWSEEMKGLQYLILNQHEATSFTGTKTLENAMSKLNEEAPGTRIVVTLGENGAAYYSARKVFAVQKIDVEKLGGKVVNTAGCGDAFVGAFGAYKTLGKSDEESLQYANMAGALKATHHETRGSPTRHELEEAYQRYGR
jgi:ribokinase